MCSKCGSPNLICNCSNPEPFCTPCAPERNCPIKLDAGCVYYHLDGTVLSRLTCLNIPNISSVESILERIDAYICSAANGNTPIVPLETYTALITATGISKHTIKVDVKVSEDADNSIEIRPDGLYVPEDSYKVKVDADDTPDYLVNQLAGGMDSFLTIDVINTDGVLNITPFIDLDALCEAITNCKCSQTVSNLSKTFAPACPTNYQLSGDGLSCVSVQVSGATIENTIVEACTSYYTEYSEYGAIVYEGGYDVDGTGTGATITQDLTNGNVVALPLNTVWGNAANGSNNFGPMNRAGVWDCISQGSGELGFSVPVDAPASKLYYIGIGADDEYTLTVNGTTIVTTDSSNLPYYNNDGGAKYRYWHIYPVYLTQGINYVGLIGIDTGGIASSIAAEIYNNTLAELSAATLKAAFVSNPLTFPLDENHYNNLDLIFSTRCARQAGSTFSIGNATCPDNSWFLDTVSGGTLVSPCQGINGDTSNWVCKKTITTAFSGYSVTLVWDRLLQAVSYDVQQKLSSSSTYIDSSVTPVQNPNSGDTVSTTINGLASADMDFRVRPNYGNCFGPWQEV